jgi:LAO/AO transport system kinase
VMDAMGKDIIIIETVGVGQDEVEIVNTAHTSIVVLVPGLGDDIQAIKAGIIEIGDIFVINKCDRDGADRMERDLRMVLEMGRKKEEGWEPLIFKTEAVLGKGIFELVSGVYRHKQSLEKSQSLEKKRRERAKTIFLEVLETEVMARFIEKMEKEGQLERIIDDLINHRTDPYSMAEKVMSEELTKNH